MSQRAGQMTRQMVIGLALVLGLAVASFTAVALGASLCDLRKELQKAESELQELEGLRSSKAQLEEDQRRAEKLIHGNPSSPDPNERLGLKRKKEELDGRLQSVRNSIEVYRNAGRMADMVTFQGTENLILQELQRVNQALTDAQNAHDMAERSLTRLTALEGKEAELKKKVAQFKDEFPERQRRFQKFMDCYQLAVSMRAFSKSTQNGMLLNPDQMDDKRNLSSPRSEASRKYDEAYIKFYKTDFTDEVYHKLGTALRKKLGEIGEQFFDGANNAIERDMGYLGQDTGKSRQGQIAALRNQYKEVISGGSGPICDAMRNLVNQGEKLMWDSLPQPIYINSDTYFTRKETSNSIPDECSPPSVTVP